MFVPKCSYIEKLASVLVNFLSIVKIHQIFNFSDPILCVICFHVFNIQRGERLSNCLCLQCVEHFNVSQVFQPVVKVPGAFNARLIESSG